MLLFKKRKEKRFFARINCTIPCSVYGSDVSEDIGTIQNMSEEGMFVALSPEITKKISVNDRLTIQLFDQYTLFNRDYKVYLNVVVSVVRKGDLGIGCMVVGQDRDYAKYVSDKKIIDYLDSKALKS